MVEVVAYRAFLHAPYDSTTTGEGSKKGQALICMLYQTRTTYGFQRVPPVVRENVWVMDSATYTP